MAQAVDLPVNRITLGYGGEQFVFNSLEPQSASFSSQSPKVFLLRPRNKRPFPVFSGVRLPPEADDEDLEETKPWTTITDDSGQEMIQFD